MKFQGELHLPGSGRSTGDGASRSRNSSWRKYDQIWSIEVGTIEQIEEFSSKLERQPLSDCGVFERREVPGPQPWAVESISTQIAPESAVGWRG